MVLGHRFEAEGSVLWKATLEYTANVTATTARTSLFIRGHNIATGHIGCRIVAVLGAFAAVECHPHLGSASTAVMCGWNRSRPTTMRTCARRAWMKNCGAGCRPRCVRARSFLYEQSQFLVSVL
jgi:hypothetical protein